MWFSSSQERRKRLEKETLYTMQIETTRIAVNDYNIYTFSEPLFIRQMSVNADCYYYDESYLPRFIPNGTPAEYPVNTITVVGSGRYAFNNDTMGGFTRLLASRNYQFFPEPLRVRWMKVGAISGSVVMTIHYLIG